jgi:hypothetical protein
MQPTPEQGLDRIEKQIQTLMIIQKLQKNGDRYSTPAQPKAAVRLLQSP